MPKPPPIEYFMLSTPTPKSLLGEAVAALTNLGLTEINFELMTDVPAFARNKSTHEVKAADFLGAFIAEHPTFSQKEVSALFKKDGRQASAGYYAMSKLLEQGVIKKLDDNGNYSRADVKQIAAPKKAKTKPAITRDKFDVNHRDFILGYARQHNGRMSGTKLREYFEKHGRKAASVGGALNMLKQRKLIKLLGDGEYVLASKVAPKPKPAKEPAKANGIAPPVTETEAANGNG